MFSSMRKLCFVLLYLICFMAYVIGHRDPRHCEVCIKVLEKYVDLAKTVNKANPFSEAHFDATFKDLCKNLSDKEERFCYYMGGLETSATSLLKHISRPMSFQKPIKAICEQDVSRVDHHVCDLRYDVEIDLRTVDLDKLPLKELRSILARWDESCVGCTEKSDFVALIRDLIPKKLGPSKIKTDL